MTQQYIQLNTEAKEIEQLKETPSGPNSLIYG